jgi:hypothetical protein
MKEGPFPNTVAQLQLERRHGGVHNCWAVPAAGLTPSPCTTFLCGFFASPDLVRDVVASRNTGRHSLCRVLLMQAFGRTILVMQDKGSPQEKPEGHVACQRVCDAGSKSFAISGVGDAGSWGCWQCSWCDAGADAFSIACVIVCDAGSIYGRSDLQVLVTCSVGYSTLLLAECVGKRTGVRVGRSSVIRLYTSTDDYQSSNYKNLDAGEVCAAQQNTPAAYAQDATLVQPFVMQALFGCIQRVYDAGSLSRLCPARRL